MPHERNLKGVFGSPWGENEASNLHSHVVWFNCHSPPQKETHTHTRKKHTKKNSVVPPCPTLWMTSRIGDKKKMTTPWRKIRQREVAKLSFSVSYLKCLTETTATQDWRSIPGQRSRGANSGCPSTPTGDKVETSPLPSQWPIHGLQGSDRQGSEKGKGGKERERGWLPLRALSSLRNVCSPWLPANSHYLER